MKKLIAQIIKFGGVGVLCFGIETGVLWLLKTFLTWLGAGEDLSVMLGKALAFCVAVTVNYLLSLFFVFDADASRGAGKNFVIFVILSIIGLGLNMLIMYLGNVLAGFNYMLVHIFATAVVMVYNFITRKLILERHSQGKQKEE